MAVQERTYQPQVGPGSTAPMPLGNSAVTDAIGGGMERLGSTLHQAQVQDYQIERKLNADREASDFGVKFAQARAKFDQISIDARNNPGPDAAGHAEAIGKAWEAEQQELLKGITEKNLQNRAREQLAEFGGRLTGSEYQWQEGKRVAKVVTDQATATDIAANRARQSHDPKSYAEELSLGRQSIESLEGVPEDVRDKLIQGHDQAVTVGYLNGLNDTNPRAALALVEAGAFNEILDPQQLDQARAGAMVEVRRADAAAAHQAQLEAAATREQVQGIKASIEAGINVPDAQLEQVQGKLAAIGDTGGALQMGILRVQNAVSRETEPWTPVQFDTAISQLTAKGDKRTDAESVRLEALKRQRPAAVATYNNNPGEWAAKVGMPAPPLSFSDPASIASRLTWARSVEASTGRPVSPLLPAEAASLREEAASSPSGRLAVADQIAALGGLGAVRAAQQIAPTDLMLGRLATLGSRELRKEAANGGEVRKQRKDVIDGPNGSLANDAFYDELGSAGALLAPGQVGASFEVAKNIYAARADGVEYRETAFDRAAHEALGGTWGPKGEKLGGIGTYGAKKVLLPQGMTDAKFDKLMARLPSLHLDRAKYRPVWENGTPMTGAELRKNFTPVMRPDGRYEFHDEKGAVAAIRDGRTWTLDVAQMARNIGQ